MPDAPEHKIYPYGAPEKLAEDVWLVRGNLSYPLHRNMVIIRLPTGQLVLHSVIAMEEDGLKALEALGTPAYSIEHASCHGCALLQAALPGDEAARALGRDG